MHENASQAMTTELQLDAMAGFSASDCSASLSRVWDMPNSDTFDVPSIAGFVKKYLMKSKISVDCFSRNKRWTTYTNDLNPKTAAEYHMDAEDFLTMLADKGIVSDLVICDPPYSPRQVKECYDSIGLPEGHRGCSLPVRSKPRKWVEPRPNSRALPKS